MRKAIAVLFAVLMFIPLLSGQEVSTEGAETVITQNPEDNRVRLAMSSPEYLVTPGDVYMLTFSNATGPVSIRCAVQSDYSIDLSFLGTLNGRGKTFIVLAQEVKNLVRNAYPTSFPQLTISSIGEFYIRVTGEVQQSREMTCWGMSRLDGITQSVKTDHTSIRSIIITDKEGNSSEYDLFSSFRSEATDNNPFLRPGDVVLYRTFETQVVLSGQAVAPGTYQLLPGESLMDLIDLYGRGFDDAADTDRIRVNRITDVFAEGEVLVFSEDRDNLDGITLLNRDHVTIPSRLEFLPIVYFEGAVTTGDLEVRVYSGQYLYHTARSIQDQFLENADLTKVFIQRANSEERIQVDLRDLLFNYSEEKDVVLQDGDRIVLPVGKYEVFITGEVVNSAWIDTGSLTRLSSVLDGHLTPYSSTRSIEIESSAGDRQQYDLFRAQRYGEVDQNPYLMPGDIIHISPLDRKVSIEGEVRHSGTYEIFPGDTLEELLQVYGEGFTEFSDLSRVRITRYTSENTENGEVLYLDATDQDFDFSSVFLIDRDQVHISSRLDRRPVVYIEGAVASGDLEVRIFEGQSLYHTIKSIEGRILDSADLTKAFIQREGVEENILVNLRDLIYRYEFGEDVLLTEGDRIVIPFGKYEVYVTGEVSNSAWVDTNSLTRLSSVLGGRLTDYSSTRTIEVESLSGEIRRYDLFMAQRYGDVSQDPYLMPGDIVRVNEVSRRVSIEGQIRHPGTYELKNGETLEDLIELYGDGITDFGDLSRVQIKRFMGNNEDGEVIHLNIEDDEFDFSSFILYHRDQIHIPSRLELLPIVYFEGAVASGDLEVKIYSGQMLYQTLRSIEGSISESADLSKAFIQREGLADNIQVDLRDLLYNYSVEKDRVLEDGDRIVIPFGKYEVFLSGEVTNSAWIDTGTLSRLSGVVTGHLTGYSSIRNIEVESLSGEVRTYDLFLAQRYGDVSQNPYLMPGDTIRVNEIGRRVSISGEIRREGSYELLDGETLADLIQIYGGGLTDFSDLGRIQIKRFNGHSEEDGEVLYLEADQEGYDFRAVGLSNRDEVSIPSTLELLPIVYFEGAVATGDLEVKIYAGQKLYQTVRSIQGSISDSADLTKAFIQRLGQADNIDVDIRDLLYNYSVEKDLVLEDGDRIIIPIGKYEIFLTGEVTRSAWVDTGSLARLSQVITPFLTDYSSIRNVEVEAKSGETRTYDLFRAHRYGEVDQDPYLMPGDIIRIGQVERKVTISGEIRRPGTYELLPGETLEELIGVYGDGYTDFSEVSRMKITRYLSDYEHTGEIFYLTTPEGGQPDLDSVDLHHRDSVTILNRLALQPYVIFEGAVRTGAATASAEVSSNLEYSFLEGEMLSSAIMGLHAQGLFSEVTDLENAYVKRGGMELPIDLRALINERNPENDIQLHHLDEIIIPFQQYFVTVSGAVLIPGRYPYIPGRSYYYYINLAGGFDSTRNMGESVRIYDMYNQIYDKGRIVQPEDMIVAEENNPLYQIDVWAGVLGTLTSIVTATLAILNLFK